MTPEQRVRSKSIGFSKEKNTHFNQSEEISEFLTLMGLRYQDYPPLEKCQICAHGGKRCTQAGGLNVELFYCYDYRPLAS